MSKIHPHIMTSGDFEIRRMVVGSLHSNCYALIASGECVVVDAGACGAALAQVLSDVRVMWIIATHGHGDHVSGVAALKEATGASFAMSSKDIDLARVGWPEEADDAPCSPYALKPDQLLAQGDVIMCGDKALRIIECPGHSPGGLTVMGEGIACTGDTLFKGSMGRCDLPGGDHDVLLRSLAHLVDVLPLHTTVLPGHGPSSTIERELKENPYLVDNPYIRR